MEHDRTGGRPKLEAERQGWAEYIFGICRPDGRIGKHGSRYAATRREKICCAPFSFPLTSNSDSLPSSSTLRSLPFPLPPAELRTASHSKLFENVFQCRGCIAASRENSQKAKDLQRANSIFSQTFG